MDLENLDAVTKIEIEAIIGFVRAKVPYQSRVARIMRTVSEALHFGGDYWNSTKGKSLNRRMSRQASLLLERAVRRLGEDGWVRWLTVCHDLRDTNNGISCEIELTAD